MLLLLSLVAGKYMRAPAEASLADKGRAKGRKAAKRAGSGSNSLQGFRKYTTPAGMQVSVQVMIAMLLIAMLKYFLQQHKRQ